MIKTQEEYKSALDLINQDIETYDFELPEKMNSYVYNLYLQDIEYYLDLLYEKYRQIEDLCDYLKSYADTKIDNVINDIAVKEKILENSIDKFTDIRYKAYDIEWEENSKIYDRDGSELEIANVNYNNCVGPKRYYNGQININSIEKSGSNYQTYSDNILTCLIDGYYMTSYSLDKPSTIEETLKFNSDDDIFKYIELKPFNCEIEIKDSQDRKEITVRSASMSKTYENFSLNNYNKNSLNSLDNISCYYNQSSNVIDNDKNIATALNIKTKEQYIDTVKAFQENTDTIENTARLNKEMAK